MSIITPTAVDVAAKLSGDELFAGVPSPLILQIVTATLVELTELWQLDDRHVMAVGEGEWAVQHPIQERPNLLNCPVTVKMAEFVANTGVPVPGKYLVWLEEVEVQDAGPLRYDTELFFTRLDDIDPEAADDDAG